MPEKCETCGGRGFVFGIATPGMGIRCLACRRFDSFDAMRAHILFCCESHDELLAACNVCDRAISELAAAVPATSTDWINLRAARNLARTAVDKARPVKESTPTQGASDA